MGKKKDRKAQAPISQARTAGPPSVVNPGTGLGMVGTDKSVGTVFPISGYSGSGESYGMWRSLYRSSWAARKCVDLVVEDAMSSWRMWIGDDEHGIEMMEEAERQHKVRTRLAKGLQMGRLYGGAVLAMITAEAPLDTPLNPDRIRPGDLRSLLPVERYRVTVMQAVEDLFDPAYGEPLLYRLNLPSGHTIPIHASRVLRIIGQDDPDSTWGDSVYRDTWGDSILKSSLSVVLYEAQALAGAAHLTQEASILTVYMQSMQDVLAGEGLPNDKTPDQMGAEFNAQKSIYHTMFAGPNDRIERLGVSWSGLAELLDRFHSVTAASQDIPLTRFMNTSAIGMNATGEGDWRTWSDRVNTYQRMGIAPLISQLDTVLARDAGVREVPTYEWNSLMEMSELEKATVAKMWADSADVMLKAGFTDEEEVRAWLTDKAHLPEFPENWVAPEPEPMLVQPRIPPPRG